MKKQKNYIKNTWRLNARNFKNIIKCLDDAKVNDIKIYETKDITPFYDYIIKFDCK